jgi:hypothetical protein
MNVRLLTLKRLMLMPVLNGTIRNLLFQTPLNKRAKENIQMNFLPTLLVIKHLLSLILN